MQLHTMFLHFLPGHTVPQKPKPELVLQLFGLENEFCWYRLQCCR